MTQPDIKPPRRLDALDGLRGLAAALVVLYHYVLRYDEIYGHADLGFRTDWAVIGKFGVQLFFIISGFAIYWTLSRARSGADFLTSRFARLYPAYWAAALLTFLAIKLADLPGRDIGWEHAAANILMFQEYLKIPHIDGVYWTLTMELTFYVWAFALFKLGHIQRFERYALPLLLLAALVKLKLLPWHPFLSKILLLQFGSYFILGMCLYKLQVQSAGTALTHITLVLALLSPLLGEHQAYFPIVVLIYLLFFGALRGWFPFLRSRPLLFLGSISYTLYLVHQYIGYILIREATAAGVPSLLSIVIAATICMALAWVLTVWVERPAQQWIKSARRSQRQLQT